MNPQITLRKGKTVVGAVEFIGSASGGDSVLITGSDDMRVEIAKVLASPQIATDGITQLGVFGVYLESYWWVESALRLAPVNPLFGVWDSIEVENAPKEKVPKGIVSSTTRI